MRRLLLVPLALTFALSGCSGPCQDLGDRLCKCVGVGTTRDACERSVKEQLKDHNPSKDVEDLCDQRLKTCRAPDGAQFCEWINTACGKASCGLSSDEPATACEPAAAAALEGDPGQSVEP
jgi:hypothetical protein